MMRLVSSSILIFCFLFENYSMAQTGVDEIPVVQVSKAQFEQITKSQKVLKQLIIAQNNSNPVREYQDDKLEKENKKKRNNDLNNYNNSLNNNGPKSSSNTSFNFSGGGGGGGGKGEAVLIIFVVVGAVIILAWLPYFPMLLYKAVTEKENIKFLNLLYYQRQFFFSDNEKQDGKGHWINATVKREGCKDGVNYGFYLKERNQEGIRTNMGIGVEVGSYTIEDTFQVTGEKKKYQGPYALIGPSLFFGNDHKVEATWFGNIDLLFGTSYKKEVGFMSSARIGANVILTENFFVGVGFAGDYFDTKATSGFVTEGLDMSLSYYGRLGMTILKVD